MSSLSPPLSPSSSSSLARLAASCVATIHRVRGGGHDAGVAHWSVGCSESLRAASWAEVRHACEGGETAVALDGPAA